jgi:hypothetical protein
LPVTHQDCECAPFHGERPFASVHTMRMAVRTDFETLLELHVIGDRLHAVDGARHPHCVLDIGARAHEAAELNDALEGLDLDLGYLEAGLIEGQPT